MYKVELHRNKLRTRERAKTRLDEEKIYDRKEIRV
jgi:hypothetical protein